MVGSEGGATGSITLVVLVARVDRSTGCVVGAYATLRTTSVCVPDGRFRRKKFPLLSVTVLDAAPKTVTSAPASGLSAALTTRPVSIACPVRRPTTAGLGAGGATLAAVAVADGVGKVSITGGG